MKKYGDSRKGVELFKIEEKKVEESKKRPLLKAKAASSKDDSDKRKKSGKRPLVPEKASTLTAKVEYRQKLEAYEPLKVDYKSLEAMNFAAAHASAGDQSASSDMASSMRSLTSSRRSPTRRVPTAGKGDKSGRGRDQKRRQREQELYTQLKTEFVFPIIAAAIESGAALEETGSK